VDCTLLADSTASSPASVSVRSLRIVRAAPARGHRPPRLARLVAAQLRLQHRRADCVFADSYKCCDTGLCRACRPSGPVRTRLSKPIIKRCQGNRKARLVINRDVSGSLVLTWSSGNSTTEQRVEGPCGLCCSGSLHGSSPGRASGWQNVSLVVGDAVAVEEVRSGHIYQFRVAAVSRLWPQGFRRSVGALLKSEAPPQAPGAPSSLSEGRLRIYSSGRVSVRVQLGAALQLTSCPCTCTRSYLIENLEPGASYKVEVRAASLGDERLYWAAQQHLPRRSPPGPPQLPSSRDRPGSSSGGDSTDNDEACSTAVSASSYDQLTAAQPGSPTPLHIQQPVYDNGQLTVRMLILGVSVGSEETLYRVLWRRRVCIDSPGNGKLFQMTVVAEVTRLLPADSAAVQLPLFSSASSPWIRRLRSGAFETSPPAFRTPSCDEVKLASGSPPPEQCPAALKRSCRSLLVASRCANLPRPVAETTFSATWSPGLRRHRRGTTASDSSTSHRRRRGRGTSISATASSGARLEEPVSQSSYLAASAGGRGAASAAARSAPAASAKSSGVVGGADGGNVNGGLYPQMDPDRAVTRVLPRQIPAWWSRTCSRASCNIVQVHSQALANGQLLVSRSSSYFFATPPGLSGDGGRRRWQPAVAGQRR
uniref:Fibronectin type-III domain-containing protein n=1 Tax=Macrostomum lignano TaxID=282301 RepID=A0A1I8JPX4_9PLAT